MEARCSQVLLTDQNRWRPYQICPQQPRKYISLQSFLLNALIRTYIPVFSAVQSILRQTYDKYEIIIVDDGSTDHTWEIIRMLEEKDDRIRYIKLDKNQEPVFLQ